MPLAHRRSRAALPHAAPPNLAPPRAGLPPPPDLRLARRAAAAAGVGALVLVLFQQGYAIEALQSDLAARPPVAVIDYAPVTAAIAEGRAPEEIEPLFRRLKAMSDALRGDGFVVLNRTAVDAAPPALVVTVDALAPRATAAPSPSPQPFSPAPAAPAAAAPVAAEPVASEPGLSDAEARALIGALTGEPRR